jgi:hypothetical protein
MNGPNNILVAVITFGGTVFLVVILAVVIGLGPVKAPAPQTIPDLRDTSQAVRMKPGGNAAHSVALSAARTQISGLERALKQREQAYSAEKKKSQQLARGFDRERKSLIESVRVLENLFSATDERISKVTPIDAPAVTFVTSESPRDPAADVEGPVEEIAETGSQIEQRLDSYVDRLRESHTRLTNAARLVVLSVGEPAIEGLIGMLESNDPAIQIWALETLEELGPLAGPAVPTIRDLRAHPLPDVADLATRTLAEIRD